MSRQRTKVDAYLDSKGLDYQINGDQAVMLCPFCQQTSDPKFYINRENYLYTCHRGKCGIKGNEKTFKRHFGDSVVNTKADESNWDEEQTPKSPQKNKEPEPIPDIEKYHRLLLESDDIVNFLNDERAIGSDTIKVAKLGLGKRKFEGGVIANAIMYPYFEGGSCVGVKYRSLPPAVKDFRFTANREVGIYRQDVITKDMESLILCEGEIDTLTLVDKGYQNTVGVPGCKGKKVEWAEKLLLPKRLYLVFDNDETGQEGARDFATRFGINRFFNVVIPRHSLPEPVVEKEEIRTTIKDINEFFATGHTVEEFNELLENARPFDIDGVTTMDVAFDNVIKTFNERGTFAPKYMFKWESVNAKAKGMNDGDLIVILAAAKTGKTTWCLNQTEFMAGDYGINPHFDCMEMDGEDLTKKWAAMKLCVDEDTITIEQMFEARKIARSRSNQFIFTRSRPETLEGYINHLRQIKARYDSGVIVIDNFQILVDLTIGRDRNNRPAYMSLVSKTLKALAGELRVPIILISQPKQLTEDKPVTVNDSEGSSTLTKDADLFFTLNRAPEVKMKLTQMDSVGKLDTTQSHSDKMFVEIGLSRRSSGGYCTLRIDGAKSIIREYTDEETLADRPGQAVGDMSYVDDNEVAEAV